MNNDYNPLIITDEELLKACADSHSLYIRKAGERWAKSITDLIDARANADSQIEAVGDLRYPGESMAQCALRLERELAVAKETK
jgi:hypothetical protein